MHVGETTDSGTPVDDALNQVNYGRTSGELPRIAASIEWSPSHASLGIHY